MWVDNNFTHGCVSVCSGYNFGATIARNFYMIIFHLNLLKTLGSSEGQGQIKNSIFCPL